MALICKQSSICNRFIRHKVLGVNFIGNREITEHHRTLAEVTKKKVSGKSLVVVQKGREGKSGTSGSMVKPTDMDKVILLWNKNYNSPDEIPEYVDYSKLQLAVHTRRIIVYLWLMLTLTVFLVTVIQCGQYRTRRLLIRIQDEQDKIWKSKENESVKPSLDLVKDAAKV